MYYQLTYVYQEKHISPYSFGRKVQPQDMEAKGKMHYETASESLKPGVLNAVQPLHKKSGYSNNQN